MKEETPKDLRKFKTKSVKKVNDNHELVGTWNAQQVKKRILEIEADLEKGSTSKARKKALYHRISKLRKAFNGEGIVGGNRGAKKVTKKKKGSASAWRKSLTAESRWKECLCCRGKGHTMAECTKNPANDNKGDQLIVESQAGTSKSVCFNCGQDNHTIWTCRKPRSEDGKLPFASCFLCSEVGHLASQCQQNTTGIYPKGGGCHVCASPYHLMKDCPSKTAGQQNDTDKLQRKRITDRRHENYGKIVNKGGISGVEESKAGVGDEDNDAYWE